MSLSMREVALEEDVVHGGLDQPGDEALGAGDDEGEAGRR